MDKNTFVILGDEAFQKEKAVLIIDELTAKLGGNKDNIEIIPPEKQNWHRIAENIRTFSLFGTPKFFLVNDSTVFLADEKVESVISDSYQFFESHDLDSSAKNLIKAINLLEFTDPEYKEIRENPSLLKTHLKDCSENLDFVDELLKRYPLPERLQEKAVDIDFDDLIKKIPEGHYLIITAEKWDKRTKTYKSIQKSAALFEKPVLSQSARERELRKTRENRINQYLRNIKKSVSQEAAMLLKERGSESVSIEPSLEKLSLISADKTEINADDVLSAFDDDASPNTQTIPEMIRNKDAARIFAVIVNPKNTKTDFIKLTGYFKILIRNSISIKEISQQGDYGDYPAFERRFYNKYIDVLPKETLKTQHPYFLYQCYAAFKNFTEERLKSAYIELFEIDRALKTTQKSPVDLYIDFIGFLLTPKN